MFFSEILFETSFPQHKNQESVLQKPEKNTEISKPQVKRNEVSPQDSYNDQQDGEDGYNDVGEDGIGEDFQQLPPDFTPIKRYILIEKIRELNTILLQYNIKNQQLETVLTFINDLPYDALVMICIELIPSIEEQIVRLSNGKNNS